MGVHVELKKAAAKTSPEQPLFSGKTPPVSGMYNQTHADCGYEKQIWARMGEALPLCPACGGRSEFRLVQRMIHISEDQDFGNP